jgi:hypothetical protein
MEVKIVDLSRYFNALVDDEIHHKPGNNLKNMPHGISELAGTTFDVKGVIQLSGSISKKMTGHDYPEHIKGIKINQKGNTLHFLQSASWHDKANTKIGEYQVHYKNGQKEIIPIIYQQHVVDWWFEPGDQVPTHAEIAWKGDNDRTRGQGYTIQIYKYTWKNPKPNEEIQEIEFLSDGKESAPFLMAITIE